MEELTRKVISFMEKHQMLLPGDRAVAGISGGADSVCLLFVLLEWQKRYGLEFAAVHVNHGIRAEAGQDAAFVEALCRKQGVPYYLREVDARGFASQKKCSEEEAGRLLRYEAFEEIAREFSANKIAVAHNLNDRGETMLFNLFRGSGLRGLAGIPPVREGRAVGDLSPVIQIIRPLLCVERREIEEYLERLGQGFCRDATNDTDDYTRNRIRHHILPYAEREIFPGCVRHMGSTAELLAETEDYLEQQTKEAKAGCVREFDGPDTLGYQIDIQDFLRFHAVLQKRVLYDLMKSLSPGAKDISRVHVEDVLTLFTAEGNRQFCLPFGIRARREYGRVLLDRVPPGQGGADGVEGSSREGALTGLVPDFSVFSAEELPKNDKNAVIFPENQYTKWFDYDKIKKWPVLRTRASGDYLTIADGSGGMHHKSLKAYMVSEKIPKGQRDRIPVLAADSHILWLVGYRISEYYKVTENTKRVLQVQLVTEDETEDKNGGTC